MARRIGRFAFVLCGAPSYIERCGTPRVPADLSGHGAVRFRFPTTGQLQPWSMVEQNAAAVTALVCSNMEAISAAAIQGLGLAYMPDFLAHDAIEAGHLLSVLDDYRPPLGQFSLVWPSSRHMTPRLRAFVDFVCRQARFPLMPTTK